MGISPPVVTEFVDYFAIAENITDVVILATQEEKVRESVVLAKVALRHKYLRIRTHVIPFQDILSTQTNLEFMRIAAKTIKVVIKFFLM